MIETVNLPGTQIAASRLGMGCASLGSRYGAAAGLTALARACDHGITWFDLAPAYGAGQAEEIFGQFVQGRRDRVSILTKVGALPPTPSLARRIAMPLVRPVAARVKRLRSAIRKSGLTANTLVEVTGAMIETSLARSLARLRTDYVDVLALHMPSTDAMMRDDVLRALEQAVVRGQTRYIGVAGTLEGALVGARSARYHMLQLADDATSDPLEQVRAAATGPVALVSHSILGATGARAILASRLSTRPDVLAEAQAAGFGANADVVSGRLLMARAFASNPDGVVLASMFRAAHLESNLAAVALPRPLARDLVARALV